LTAVPSHNQLFARAHAPRVLAVAISALFLMGAPCAGAQQAQPGGYLEAMGGTVPVSQVHDAGRDVNPLLADEDDAQDAPAAPTHDGGVGHVSNVGRTTNVPVPATAGAQRQTVQPGAQTVAARNAQPHPGNATPVEPLPSPKLDIVKEVVNRIAPADTEQLRRIKEEIYNRTGAAVTPMNNDYVGRASQYQVDLSPGATPPVVRVAQTVGAAVSFVDAAGNPWPITFARNFHTEAASVTQVAPHVLSVTAVSPHLQGSVVVMLKGLTTPVTFLITPAQRETDYRADLQIPGLSPDAPPVPGALSTRPDIKGGNLMDFLYGATPDGAKRLAVKGKAVQQSNTRAWQNSNGQLVLRTSAQVISPGWYNMQPALDGTAVYSLPSTPVVRVSVDGRIETFTVEGLTPPARKTASSGG